MTLLPRTVGILGGMGPAAGADFARLFVQACAAHLHAAGRPVRDQAFPEHWLAQLPLPDRTAALVDPSAPQPFEAMRAGVQRLAGLGAGCVAIACNTAHAWHEDLQVSCREVRILHAMDEVAQRLAQAGEREVGLLATEGTYRSGLYARALEARGIACKVPAPAECRLITEGIYCGVKAARLDIAAQAFERAAMSLVEGGVRVVIMGCTEIPLALDAARLPVGVQLVDAAQVLAQRLAAWAYGAD